MAGPPLVICFLAPSYRAAHVDIEAMYGIDRVEWHNMDRGLIHPESVGLKTPFRIFLQDHSDRFMRGHRFSEVVPLPGFSDERLIAVAHHMIRPFRDQTDLPMD